MNISLHCNDCPFCFIDDPMWPVYAGRGLIAMCYYNGPGNGVVATDVIELIEAPEWCPRIREMITREQYVI